MKMKISVVLLLAFFLSIFQTNPVVAATKTVVEKGDGVKVVAKTDNYITIDFSKYVKSDRKNYEVQHLRTAIDVYYGNESKRFNITTNSCIFTVSNLSPDVPYTIEIKPEYKWTFDGSVSSGFTYVGYTVKGFKPSVIKTVKFNVGNHVDNPKVTKVKTAELKGNTLYTTFKEVDDVEGYEYEIYYLKDKKYLKFKSKCKTTKVAEATIKGLKKKTTYYIRVRSFSGKKFSKWSDNKYFIHEVALNNIESQKTVTENSVTLSWSGVDGAKSYIIYCSDSRDGGYKKVGKTSRNKIKITKYNKKALSLVGKKWFYVVAVTKVKGKTVKSTPFSVLSCQYN